MLPKYEGHGGIIYFLISLNDSNEWQITNINVKIWNHTRATKLQITILAVNLYGLSRVASKTFMLDQAGRVNFDWLIYL